VGVLADGRVLTFHLRGRAVSRRAAVTSADVLYTYERVIDPRIAPSDGWTGSCRSTGGDPDDVTVR